MYLGETKRLHDGIRKGRALETKRFNHSKGCVELPETERQETERQETERQRDRETD